MSHKTAWRVVGVIMVVLALVNIAAQFAIFPTRGDELVAVNEEDEYAGTTTTPWEPEKVPAQSRGLVVGD